MFALTCDSGQYLVLDFSKMTDEQLFALRSAKVAVRVVTGKTTLAVMAPKELKLWRDELLNQINPDLIQEFDAFFLKIGGPAGDAARAAAKERQCDREAAYKGNRAESVVGNLR